MSKKDEALKLALEALEDARTFTGAWPTSVRAITAIREALAEQPAQQQEPEYKGWYCAHCQRGVDGSEVTYHEQHTVCGRVITDDVPPKAQQQEPYGQVTVVRRPGCVDQHWFYRWPEPPYLDNAAECHTVYTSPPAQRKPLTDEQITAGARALCQRMAESCNVDARDQWQLYAETFKEDAKAVLEAAHGIKGDA